MVELALELSPVLAPLPHWAGGESEALQRDGRGRLEAEDGRKQGGTRSAGFVARHRGPGGALAEEPGRPQRRHLVQGG